MSRLQIKLVSFERIVIKAGVKNAKFIPTIYMKKTIFSNVFSKERPSQKKKKGNNNT